MRKIFSTFLLLPLFGLSQNSQSSSNDAILDKWLKAVINIETVPTFQTQYDAVFKSNLSTKDKYNQFKLLDQYKLFYKNLGSAIFLQDSSNYFLVTARHMLISRYDSNDICETIILANDPQHLYQDIGTQSNDYIDTVHNVIAMNMFNGTTQNVSMKLMNFEGMPKNWVLTSKDTDLAVIKIDDQNFLDTLRKRFSPISLNDIDLSDNLKEGTKIIAIGFPQQSYSDTIINRIPFLQFNESVSITLPTISYGYAIAINKNSYFFEGQNIYINHGNSGGAIVNAKNSKLEGIVSRFPPEWKSTANNQHYKIAHMIFIKAALIKNLIPKTITPRY